jgi:hypothetical protein
VIGYGKQKCHHPVWGRQGCDALKKDWLQVKNWKRKARDSGRRDLERRIAEIAEGHK